MKKTSFLILALIVVNILVIGSFFFRYVSSSAPIVGHDYRYFIPHLIDNYLFQRINGLSVHWYTPSFAGGEPVYPNPQDIEYSLPQLLVWFFDPWRAVRLSMVIYIAAGFLALYFFLNRRLELNPFASILGAAFCIANGFFIQHMVVGHVTFQTFPLLGIILVALFSRRLPSWLGGLILSLLTALLIYAGSFEIIVSFSFSILLTLPIVYLIKPSLFDARHLVATILWGVVLSLLLCGSKLYAISSLLAFSPRTASDRYTTDWLTGLVGMVYQLLGSMTIIPFHVLFEGGTIQGVATEFAGQLGRISGSPYGMWELDISLSPALLLLLVGGMASALFRRKKTKQPFDKKRLIAEICLVLLVWLVVEFTLAKGLVYPTLHDLPILKSLRVNVRFTAVFIYPLAITGAAIFHNWTKNWKHRLDVFAAFLLLDCLALFSMWIYYKIPIDLQQRIFDIREVLPVYPAIRKQGNTFPVETVIPDANPWEVFEDDATNLKDPYEPLFKSFDSQYLETLHAGPVSDITNGSYNLINPTGYVYPAANGTSPFARISASDQANFTKFINRRQTNWKLPLAQRVLDWISLILLIAELGLLLFFSARQGIRLFRQKVKHA
ncbi:MAG TPA: hypothetical protein VMC09_16590 [Anaerolineales bacterium]|nr:hypothetical protein [Anaerolineales bacterium]